MFRFLDAFNNIEKIGRIKAPVLVIHGTDSEVVDFSHGLAIHDACTNAVEPLWVEDQIHQPQSMFDWHANEFHAGGNTGSLISKTF